MQKSFAITAVLCCCVGCSSEPQAERGQRTAVLRLAVTTSTRDSGLLDQLVPIFESDRNVRVDVIAVGTGAALRLAERGDVDAVLVHARQAEQAFMAAGHGARREVVMYNTFEILGNPRDDAQIRGLPPAEALQRIAKSQHRFLSRGDQSGTHQREQQLWEMAGGRPAWKGYLESGQGMGATLIMADEMNAYVLVDKGTYLRFKDKIRLVPLVARSEQLHNPYGLIVVDPHAHAQVDDKLADAFADFVISPRAQDVIRRYRLHGEQLFFPLHLSSGESLAPSSDRR